MYRPTTAGNQSWTFRGAADTWKPPALRHSAKCGDVDGTSTADGAAVLQYGCDGGTNQQLKRG